MNSVAALSSILLANSQSTKRSSATRRLGRYSSTDIFKGKNRAVWAVIFLFMIFVVALVREAWLHEDAFITLRTVDNFNNGYGLRWNVTERVQVYTHPLWMFLLAATSHLTNEYFFTTLFVSLLVSLLTVALLHIKLSPSAKASIIMLFVVVSSRSFLDYSTSGLENPLTHFLMVLFALIYFTRPATSSNLFWLTIVASLAGINRLDTLLFYLPALLIYFIQVRKVIPVLLGILPLVGWLSFATLYYGSPFPNTAYAKLSTHLPSFDLLIQGLFYVKDLILRDPLTFLVIAGGITIALLGRERKAIFFAMGICLYLAYVIKIGGDYMSGRFFTAAFVAAVILWLRSDWLASISLRRTIILSALVLILGGVAANPVLWPIESARRQKIESGITDERIYYDEHTGLIQNLRSDPPLAQHWLATPGIQARDTGAQFLQKGGVGLAGFFAGPDVYIIDTLALADPLIARLPAGNIHFWRVGHIKRARPTGYDETLISGQMQIEDQNIRTFYEQLSLIKNARLLDPERLRAIWRLNTGQYNDLIDPDDYIIRHLDKTTAVNVGAIVEDGKPLDAPEVLAIPFQGIQIDMGEVVKGNIVDISLDTNYEYRLVYLLGGTEQASQEIVGITESDRLQRRQLAVPEVISTKGFDTVRIVPMLHGLDKKHQRGLGHFALTNSG